MGQCSSIGLGIALARPDVRVICLDGDGSLLMNLGSLCTIATLAPRNLALVIWDNESHQTTGGQATATAHRSSFAQMARGGDREGAGARGRPSWAVYDRILAEDGPFVVPVKVSRGRSEGGSAATWSVRAALPAGARWPCPRPGELPARSPA
jgi:thiamine pyrophosphate-dependent acetolactate synthase large subunit-like protein